MIRLDLGLPWDAIEEALARARKAAVDALASELLILVEELFEAKSHGSAGADGVTWSPLTDEGLRSRARRRPEYKGIQAERKEIADRGREMRTAIGRRVPSGLSDAGVRRSIAGAIAQELFGDEPARLKQRREQLRSQEASIIASVSNGLIGVDTGKMGLALSSIDAEGSLFSVDDTSITVGVDLANSTSDAYPSAFDDLRSLLPENVLPESWVERLTAVAVEAFEREFQ